MRISYRVKDQFDIILFSAALLLCLIGLASIYSATQTIDANYSNFNKQIAALGIGLFISLIIYFLPSKIFSIAAMPAYFVSALMLIIVLVIGRSAGGAKSWISFGAINIQPAEYAKIATVIMMAYFLSKKNVNIESLKDLAITLSLAIFPVILILLEPDLGSAIVFFGMTLALIFWKGISLFGLTVVLSPAIVSVASLFGATYLLIVLALLIVALIFFKKDLFTSGTIMAINIGAGFFVDFVYEILSPHQQRRIHSFLDPASDPLGSGYNAIQAQIAIGSGGFWGKGFLSGNQTQLQFIPEQWTDFIFCVIGEEFGFFGGFIIILLYSIIFFRLLQAASQAKNEFFSLMIIGILSIFLTHFTINIGMAIGLLPVIGIPLPFVSYGGSSLISNFIMIAIVLNIYRTRKEHT